MKDKIILLAFLFLIILLAVILIPVPSSHANGLLAGKAICLDPGHGGPDPGATNGPLLEKSINLDVSFRLRQLLEGRDALVFMTREVDDFPETLTNSDRYTYCNEMQDEMRYHLEMEIRQNVERGMDPAEARRKAMVDFGGVERFNFRETISSTCW